MKLLADPAMAEAHARELVEGLALCTQAALLARYAPAAAFGAFVSSRLEDSARAFGTLSVDPAAAAELLRRARLET